MIFETVKTTSTDFGQSCGEDRCRKGRSQRRRHLIDNSETVKHFQQKRSDANPQIRDRAVEVQYLFLNAAVRAQQLEEACTDGSRWVHRLFAGQGWLQTVVAKKARGARNFQEDFTGFSSVHRESAIAPESALQGRAFRGLAAAPTALTLWLPRSRAKVFDKLIGGKWR